MLNERTTKHDALNDPRIEAFGRLLEAHNHLVTQLNNELEERCGLSLQWFEVLIRLARTPGECLNATQLAADIALSSGGATRLVDRIANVGLVERRRDPVDRRLVHVCLTTSGKAELAKALPVHLAGLDRHLALPLGYDIVRFAELADRLRGTRP